MKKIVVTGATSMVGVALIKECIQNNVEVLAIVRKQSNRLDRLPDSKLIKICQCDIKDLNNVSDDNKNFDVFYHFAWDYTSKNNRNNSALQERNIKYTLDAVELAKRLGCRKFIGAGSQAEYGKVADVITPDTPVFPLTAYGTAKYAAGKLSQILCSQYEMVHIWGRIFSVYGRNDNDETMLNYAIDQFSKGELAKFSSATQMWDYLHESDVGKIFYLLGKCIEKSKTYCIANGAYRPLKEYINELQKAFGGKAICEFADDPKVGSPIELRVDVSDLVEDIGYRSQVSFEEGITDLIEYRTKVWGGGGVIPGSNKILCADLRVFSQKDMIFEREKIA